MMNRSMIRSKRIVYISCLTVILWYAIPTSWLEAQTTIYASKDAYCEAAEGNANYNNQNLKLGATSSPYNQYMVGLYFDLPIISANQVTSAQLILTKQSGTGTQSTTSLLPIVCVWDETQLTGNGLNSCVNFPAITTINNLSGDITIDITSAFKGWLNNPSTYHGVVLVPEISGSLAILTYYDREHGDNITKPKIVYTSTPDLVWGQIGSLNVSRLRARSEVLNGQILCVGGFNGSSALNTYETYQSGQWHIGNSQLSVPRYEFTSCILQNKVFVFGGQNGTDVTNVAESFDGSVWTPAGVMPVRIYDLDGTVIGSSFYIFGGLTNIGSTYVYDNKIRKYSPSNGWSEGGDILSPPSTKFTSRAGYRCVSVGAYAYVIGGAYSPNSTTDATYFSEVWRFDPSASESNQWIQRASMHEARADFACAAGGKIYVIGGISNSSSNPATSGEVYDPQTNTWSYLVDQPDLTIPQPSNTVINNSIYVLGLGSNYTTCYESNQLPSLPIQIAEFTASVLNQSQVLLNWTTLTEINNYGFEIQKADQSQSSFQSIPNCFIPGHGTTLEEQHYSYVDTITAFGRWFYRLKQIDLDGTAHYTCPIYIDVVMSIGERTIPPGYLLYQNYPNPFNPVTIIRYELPVDGYFTLRVYDVLGQEVATLVDRMQEAGHGSADFDGSRLPSGIYFYMLKAGRYHDVKKMLLVR